MTLIALDKTKSWGNSTSRSRTREYFTTAITDLPAQGADANAVDTFFPAGWIVENSIMREDDRDQNNNELYRVTITAAPGRWALPAEEGEDVVVQDPFEAPYWFEFGEELAEHGAKQGSDSAYTIVKYPNVLPTYHTTRWYEYSAWGSFLSSVFFKFGLINNAAGMPYPDAVLGAWKLVGVTPEIITRHEFKALWVYEHPGRDRDGNATTWVEKAGFSTEAYNPETGKRDPNLIYTHRSGDIFPF